MASSSTDNPIAAEAAEASLATALAELQKGEKTAAALESNLTSLEKKIDALLASFEESERLRVEGPSPEETKVEVEEVEKEDGEAAKKKP